MTQFAKLFDTKRGQLLVFLDETDEGDPAITIIGERVRGVRAKASMSGWPEGEQAQLHNFEKTDQEMAEALAERLFITADNLSALDTPASTVLTG